MNLTKIRRGKHSLLVTPTVPLTIRKAWNKGTVTMLLDEYEASKVNTKTQKSIQLGKIHIV